MRIGLAFRAFFKAMFDREAAERMALALDGENPVPAISHTPEKPQPAPEKKPAAPAQNPAITLLATLQREARLIDLIHEDLDQYQDAQVGAAARPCLKQCRQSLDRMLKIEKLVDAKENESIPVSSDASPARYRWVGESSAASGQAKLVHPGWQATATDLPKWSGVPEDADVIAPAQITAT
ncbi:DUF2760 domain-containing protein [Neorhodopirellula pilleata]|uniref:DUF2760 domain-containing protein n=1 Tax=Neorhodopirellula pilleata TaxID=2714738 RepID=A0A5C6AXM9_9BACT|nr:DUF2760 domain-containing protein [Neorhodopirellula pilleata]TWU03802.1 hypothetical protein Pla100_07320 [Neorhodopirellula pilleata]